MFKKIRDLWSIIYEMTIDAKNFFKKRWGWLLFGLLTLTIVVLVLICGFKIDYRNIIIGIVAWAISIPISLFIIAFFHRYNLGERKRIMNAEECVEFYKDAGFKFIEYLNQKYPSIIIYLPGGEMLLKDIQLKINPELYQLPEDIRRFYEPVEDKLKELFLQGGYFNKTKARILNFTPLEKGLEIEIQRTFYYYTFITNSSPDYPLFNSAKVTLRKEYQEQFIKNINDLDKEIFSNHLGFGGFVISRDGKIPLFLRKSTTAVSSRMLGNTFNGSVDWHDTESINKSVINEIKEEVGIDVKKEDVLLMGIERNILWLGKTDMHLLVLVNEDFAELKKKIKKSKTKEENIDYKVLDLGVHIDNRDDLKLRCLEILDNLDAKLEFLQKKYKLAAPLMTGLYLFNQFIKYKD